MNSATTTISKAKQVKPKKQAVSFWSNLKNRTLVIKLSVIVLILALIGVGSWRIFEMTKGKILPRVQIAGLKIGNKTPAEAKVIVKNYVNQINSEGPEINYADKTLKPTIDEIGMTFNVDKVVDDAYNFGRQGNWLNRVKENSKMVFSNYNVELKPNTDEAKFDAFLGQMAKVVEVAPVDASLSVNNGAVALHPEKIGRGLDKEKLENDITTLINNDKLNNSKIDLITSELQPKIIAADTNDATLQAEEFMASAPITAIHENDAYIASKSEVGSWITFSEIGDKLVAQISRDKVNSYTSQVVSKIEIPKINREVMEGTGEVLVEGQDGRGVDVGRLSADMYNHAIAKRVGADIKIGTFPIPKEEITKNPHYQAGRYEGRWIDINLSEQTLYAFEGKTLVNQFLISGGKTGPTPTGEFSVYAKTRSQVMDGPGYYLPNVEWISWFSGDYSVHGTYWHNNFGTPMSHGCVNASNGDAEWLYNWDEVGTPVYIHT